ncbi:MAG TPA: hypothetical protein VJX91_07660 [Candidatus Eisenbacteria bacterium]|nr:hypothetical protein [Candidatus Eisenbacteria bacterium]
MDIKFKLKPFGGPDEGGPEEAMTCLTELHAKLSESQAEVRSLKRMNDGAGQVIVLKGSEVGLTDSADAAAIAAAVRTMKGTLDDVTAKLTAAQEYNRKNQEAVAGMLQMTAEKVVDDAIRNQWIDAVEREDFIVDYMKEPDRTQSKINKRKYKSILAKNIGTEGGAAPPDVFAEIALKVAEKKKADPKLTDGAAQSLVFAEDRALEGRYIVARREKGGKG